jgi:hypothetical protein
VGGKVVDLKCQLLQYQWDIVGSYHLWTENKRLKDANMSRNREGEGKLDVQYDRHLHSCPVAIAH